MMMVECIAFVNSNKRFLSRMHCPPSLKKNLDPVFCCVAPPFPYHLHCSKQQIQRNATMLSLVATTEVSFHPIHSPVLPTLPFAFLSFSLVCRMPCRVWKSARPPNCCAFVLDSCHVEDGTTTIPSSSPTSIRYLTRYRRESSRCAKDLDRKGGTKDSGSPNRR